MRRLLLVTFLGVCLAAIAISRASAAVSGLSVTPFTQEVDFSGSQDKKSFTFEVANSTDYPQTLVLQILDFGSLDETGGIAFAGTNPNKLIKKYGLSPWLSLDPATVALSPHKSSRVTATINNQSTLQPGGHYAAVLIKPQTSNASGKNPINVKSALTTLIFAKKLGGEKYDLHLSQVTHDGTIFHPPHNVTLRFFNPGNVHVIPRGIVTLQSTNGQSLARAVLNEDSGLVLPETYRSYYVALATQPRRSLWPLQSYHLRVDYRYDGLAGYASVNFTVRVLNLIVLGLWLAVIITFGGVIIGLLIWHRRRRQTSPAPTKKSPTKITIKTED